MLTKKWIGLMLFISGTQVVLAQGNESSTVYVKENMSLWSIAVSVKPAGVTVWQALIALYERNPKAFYQIDVSKLKADVTLVVPSTQSMLSLTSAQARQRLQSLDKQPQPHKQALTLDTSLGLLHNIDEALVIDELAASPDLLIPELTQATVAVKSQQITPLNYPDVVQKVQLCPSPKCYPKSPSVIDEHGFSNVGDVYISVGFSRLNNYSLNRGSNVGESGLNHVLGENGIEATVGYLWRDGITLELGYQQSDSQVYSIASSAGTSFYGQGQLASVNRKSELISPKILFSTAVGKKMSIYSGLGIGWYKDTISTSENIYHTPYVEPSFGGLYQILLGSKLHLTEAIFIDFRVQNKRYAPSMFFGTKGRLERHSTVDTTLSIGRTL
jgi:FimV-like protein